MTVPIVRCPVRSETQAAECVTTSALRAGSPTPASARALVMCRTGARERHGRLEGRRVRRRTGPGHPRPAGPPLGGRGGVKLAHALEAFGVDPAGAARWTSARPRADSATCSSTAEPLASWPSMSGAVNSTGGSGATRASSWWTASTPVIWRPMTSRRISALRSRDDRRGVHFAAAHPARRAAAARAAAESSRS